MTFRSSAFRACSNPVENIAIFSYEVSYVGTPICQLQVCMCFTAFDLTSRYLDSVRCYRRNEKGPGRPAHDTSLTFRFKQSVLQILDTTEVLTALMKFQYNSVVPLPVPEQRVFRPHRFIRQQVIKLAFDFLVNWATWNPLLIPALSKHEFLTQWIRRLALESVDSQVTLGMITLSPRWFFSSSNYSYISRNVHVHRTHVQNGTRLRAVVCSAGSVGCLNAGG